VKLHISLQTHTTKERFRWMSYLVPTYMNIGVIPMYREWKEIIAQDHSGENSLSLSQKSRKLCKKYTLKRLELCYSGLSRSGSFLPLLLTTQKSADLSYFAAEAWNHALRRLVFYRKKNIYIYPCRQI
jgi:hypothetical protein